MRILAVDTTTPSGSTALLEDARLLGEVTGASASTHSSRLLRSVDLLLGHADLDIRDIDGFAVAAGPGSFTGIRIGLSTVKSLAFASGKPVVPVSSLRALALKAAQSGANLVCPILDAKKGEIYAALFESSGGRCDEVVPQGAYAPEAFFARLPGRRAIAFIGGGAALYRDRLPSPVRSGAKFSERTLFIAHEVGLLAQAELARGGGIPAGKLEPLYFRRSQAEEGH